MAAATVRPELPVVNVIRQVAVGAACAGFVHGLQWLPVTVVTSDVYMGSCQLEIRLHVVVEEPQVPGDGVVTGFAVVLEDTLVHVVIAMAVDASVRGLPEFFRLMAAIAFLDIRVCAEQGETRQVVIEARRVGPCGFVVTIGALVSERRLVSIVVAMTVDALLARFLLENGLDMAVETGNRFVRTMQGIVGVLVVVKMPLVPGRGRMAGIAVRPVMPVMIVILTVAGDTGHVHGIDIVERVVAVAVIAAQLGVTAIEREVGIARVIEARVLPVSRAVTVFADFAAAAFVRVILGMTAETGRRCILVSLIPMTVKALGITMMAEQRKIRRVMIESHVEPVGGVVAIGTGSSQEAFVYVVVVMTIVAFLWRIAVLVSCRVAVSASHFCVFSQQFVVGQVMVKVFLVKVYDIGVAPFVIDMAGGAMTTGHVIRTAMKTVAGIDVSRDVLMAVETQPILGAAIEALVTRRALGFSLGVTRDDLARHHQGFNGLRSSGLAHQANEHGNNSCCCISPSLHIVGCNAPG